MYELMEKITAICQNTNKNNYKDNFESLLVQIYEFKNRGGGKNHARDALLKISYKFRNEDNDIAADCINESLSVIDGDNPNIKPIWE